MIYLDIPFVSQLNYGPGINDPTGCWYCSACMLAYYDAPGPRLGVPDLHTSTHEQYVGPGLGVNGHAAIGSVQALTMLSLKGKLPGSPADGGFTQLCANEGLVPVDAARVSSSYTAAELEVMLRTHGPVMFFWTKSFSTSRPGYVAPYRHASVLIGVTDEGHVSYHDPESGSNRKMTVATFNTVLQRHDYALLRRGDRSGRQP